MQAGLVLGCWRDQAVFGEAWLLFLWLCLPGGPSWPNLLLHGNGAGGSSAGLLLPSLFRFAAMNANEFQDGWRAEK